MVKFTIEGQPITKKNSQRIVTVHGRPMIIPSKQYKQYEKDCMAFMPMIDTIDYPINIKATFYMKTKRRVDLVNLEQALNDILVHYGVIEDDNNTILVSMDGSRVSYDKSNPRTEVEITEIGKQIESI